MGRYFLAIDIGASSGRHILGSVSEGKLLLEEVHRFENGFQDRNGHKCWDTEYLFSEILAGMKKCKEIGKIPVSVGVDTWGVDFVLLDESGKRLGEAVSYRDGRTTGMDAKVYEQIPEEELFARTGIQKQMYNTIYQLMAVKEQNPEQLSQAETLLMTPDYYHYLLSGEKVAEYTIASTGQLLSPETKDWDFELLDRLGYPRKIFPEIKKPGTILGSLKKEVQEAVGYDCQVILPPAHDTASAVAAVPCMEDTIYISSGTWSLMGIESLTANCSKESMIANFTNEGGYDYRFRFLKNIMGLWMIQSVRNEDGRRYSFAELCEMASKEQIPSIVDCYDDCFLAPESMIEEIQNFCAGTGQQVPNTMAELAAVIYNSLAVCYGQTVKEIEEITGKHYQYINVVGGGSNADYLNELTAKYTGRTVFAGPGEATAIGNLVVQMIAAEELKNLTEAKKLIADSFDLKRFDCK